MRNQRVHFLSLTPATNKCGRRTSLRSFPHFYHDPRHKVAGYSLEPAFAQQNNHHS